MAWTQTDIDNIKSAMASGTKRLKHGDTEKEFASLAEMKALLAQMEAEVNPTTASPRRTVASFSNGLR